MNPRRLIPYAAVFLALVIVYLVLWRHQEQRELEERQAKEVFHFNTGEITALTLNRPGEEIQLVRQGSTWEITKPLKAKADAETVGEMLEVLARLKMVRDLGPGELKSFGLDQPGLVVSFVAKGERHRLALGQPVPGGRSYYARKDDHPGVLIVAGGTMNSLNREMFNLRDRTLWAFNPDQVKSLKIRSGQTEVALERGGPHTWNWVGRSDLRVRSDRVEELLRELRETWITDFSDSAAPDLQAAGLAPQAGIEITLTTDQGAQSLRLGSATPRGVYARLGAQGQVVQVNKKLPEQINRTLAGLEDRRLWSGLVPEVGKVVWGTPGQEWTAVRERDDWKLTGAGKAPLKQNPARLEMALIDFQKLDYLRLLPASEASGQVTFTLELFDRAGKSLFRLEESGNPAGSETEVRTVSGEASGAAVISRKGFEEWREEMARLTTPPPAQL